jgi:hypothetical protein
MVTAQFPGRKGVAFEFHFAGLLPAYKTIT